MIFINYGEKQVKCITSSYTRKNTPCDSQYNNKMQQAGNQSFKCNQMLHSASETVR
jgi:hypothetical protein